MDKLATQAGVVIDLPSELSGNPTYFRADNVALSTCIDRAVVAAGGSNFALQVDEGQKHATVFLLSDFRMGGAAKNSNGFNGLTIGQAAAVNPVSLGSNRLEEKKNEVKSETTLSKISRSGTVSVGPEEFGLDEVVEDGLTMRQLNEAKDFAEIYRPNPNDIVDEFDGKPITYFELQQLTKRMENMRPNDDDVVDELDGKKMTLRQMKDIALQAENDYAKIVEKARKSGEFD
ncbi:hypothetical protein [Fundidesulfovibrio soli]|uniref:hypothetical protein n=1 Tax=Fundidesulfovibrio soli TaxID=2922716 RepID=UPI001FAF1F9A|nr:hypothetical protein [Fundidesulfovibrio soli]